MKNIYKISILVAVSAFIIWLLSRENLLHLELMKEALFVHPWLILMIALFQIFNHLAMTFRYYTLLKILDFHAKMKSVLAATFMGNGIGQWFPGSLAFIEMIRLGILTQSSSNPLPQESTRVAMASLFDRLIGFAVSLCIGGCVCFYFLCTLKNLSSANHFILLCTFFLNLSLFGLIVALPFMSGSQFMQKILKKSEIFLLQKIKNEKFMLIIQNFFLKMNEIFTTFSQHGKSYLLFIPSFCFSLCSLLGFAISLQIASITLGMTVPFLVILAIISTLGLLVALPISIGGIGIPQLVTAILFGAFGADSAQAASAQLLHTSITLVTISVCAAFYLPRIMKEIIKPRIA